MFFKDIETQHKFLSWAQFYLNLGRLYGQKILKDDSIHNTIIKVPYTNFIPHLLSLGIADETYDYPIESNYSFDWKDKLTPGILVFYKTSIDKSETPYTFIGFSESGYPIIEDKKKHPTRTQLGRDWETKIRIAIEQVTYKKSRTLKNKTLNILKKHYSTENLERLAQLNDHRILIIGNEKKLKNEAEEKIHNLEIYHWLLMRPFLHQQSYYLTDIYSSRYKGELEGLPSNTIVIYSSLDAFYNFHEELNCFSSIVLYASIESGPTELEVLSMLVDLMDEYDASSLIETMVTNVIPKGIEIGTWMVKK